MNAQKITVRPSLIVYDFDGVMTDNRVTVDEHGTEYVTVHRGDGYGVRMIGKCPQKEQDSPMCS